MLKLLRLGMVLHSRLPYLATLLPSGAPVCSPMMPPSSGSVGTRGPACRQGAAGRAPRDRRAAQPKGGCGAKTGGRARAACGGAAKGGMGAGAAHPMTVDRIPEREPRAAAPGVKGSKAIRGDAKRARRPKIWAAATPGRKPNLLPSRLYSIKCVHAVDFCPSIRQA